jgi:hypothetical protein
VFPYVLHEETQHKIREMTPSCDEKVMSKPAMRVIDEKEAEQQIQEQGKVLVV